MADDENSQTLTLVYQPDTLRPAVIAEGALIAAMADLLSTRPDLSENSDGPPALLAARAYNHFARGEDFEVIGDPDDFERAYRARIAAEDTDTIWNQQAPRLRDYGLPDFETMHPPEVSGEELAFFARDAFTGLAYLARGPLDDPGLAVYEPLDVTAFDMAASP